MIRNWTLGAGIASLTLLLGMPARGDDQNKINDSAKTEDSAAIEAAANTMQLDKVRSASKLMGHNLVNRADEKLGVVEDIVIDRMGQAHYVIVGYGGVIGSDRFVAIPWAVLQPSFEGDRCMLDMTQAKFRTAPSFTKASYNDRWTNAWCHDLHAFFGSAQQGKSDQAKSDRAEARRDAQQAVVSADKDENRLYYTSQLISSTVQNKDQQKLASIDDLLFDSRGYVAFAILGHGGILSIGEKQLAVPWRGLDLRRGEQANVFAILDMTSKQLEQAPMLAKSDFSDLLDKGFAENTYRYFGVTNERREIEAETPNQEQTETPNLKD